MVQTTLLSTIAQAQPNNSDLFLMCGLELEAEINSKIFKPQIQHSSYHSGQVSFFGKKWFVETDGSLSCSRWGYTGGRCFEFISIPFQIKQWKKVLKDFQKTIVRRTNSQRMRNTIYFNGSTGAHLHFSLWRNDGDIGQIEYKPEQYTDIIRGTEQPTQLKIPILFLQRVVRTTLHAKLQSKMPHIYEKWNSRYFRDAAKKTSYGITPKHDRYFEWNFVSGAGTIEWRSLHLYGIQTWTDFFAFWKIVFDTLHDTLLQPAIDGTLWETSEKTTYPKPNIQKCQISRVDGEYHLQPNVVLNGVHKIRKKEEQKCAIST